MTRRAVLVGWSPGPKGTDGDRKGSRGAWDGNTGTRLAKLAGIPREALHDAFELVNLFDPEPMADATPPEPLIRSAAAAAATRLAPFLEGRAVVLASALVAEAFGLPGRPWALWRGQLLLDVPVAGYATLPHPSGLCREWNPQAVESKRLRAWIRELAASPDPEADARLVTEITGAVEKPNEMVGYARAAEILGVTRGHLAVMVHRRQIAHYRVSPKKVLFRAAELRLHVLAGRVRQSRAEREESPPWQKPESARPSADESSSSDLTP